MQSQRPLRDRRRVCRCARRSPWLLSGLLAGLLMASSPPVTAEPDAWQAEAVRGGAQLRWDNLEGGPEWLQGPQPQLMRSSAQHLNWGEGKTWWTDQQRQGGQRDRVHQLELAPGETVLLRLPAQARLRLRAEDDKPLRSADLSWLRGNGSGLMLEVRPQPVDGGLELVSPLSVPSLLRLTRPLTAQGPRRLSLWLARWPEPPTLAQYRTEILPSGDDQAHASVRLADQRSGGQQRFWPLSAGTAISFDIDGPERLEVETRLSHPPDARLVAGDYRLRVQIDGRPWRHVELLAVPEYRRPTKVNGQPALLGTAEHAYLEVPEGRHRIALSANANLLLRVLARAEPDFLLPRLNRPRALREAQAELAPMPADCGAPGALVDSSNPVSDAWCQALSLARDNRFQPGGLEAVQRLDAPCPSESAMASA